MVSLGVSSFASLTLYVSSSNVFDKSTEGIGGKFRVRDHWLWLFPGDKRLNMLENIEVFPTDFTIFNIIVTIVWPKQQIIPPLKRRAITWSDRHLNEC
jgi:hypothetical protein